MSKKLFGTDGVRGMANKHPMTPEVALALGKAIAIYFSRKKGHGRIVIGKDTRRSGYLFEYALSAGISAMGAQTILTGPLPTPGIAFITRAMRADAGVVISASHNAFHDNGIKFFDKDGYKLPDEAEIQMEEYVFGHHDDSQNPTGAEIGRAVRIEDATGRYVEFLKSTFPKHQTLKGLKIVVDCAHGAAYNVGPLLFSEMDAEVISIGNKPNGLNINDGCGALYPQKLAEIVKQEKADIGIAVDGDADRLVLCDEQGEIMNGDRLLALCALAMKKEGRLPKNTVVGTIMSNMGLEVYLKQQGIHFIRTGVGDRLISEEIRKQGYSFGGEPSGHVIFGDLATTGDGLLASLQVLACMMKSGKPLSQLVKDMPLYPQVTRNIPVHSKKDLTSLSALNKELAATESALNGKGRVILRYSGTEPLLRLTIEGEEQSLLEKYLDRLTHCIQSHL